MPSFTAFLFLFFAAVLVCAPLWGLAHITFACDSSFCAEMVRDSGYIIAFLWLSLASAFVLTCLGTCCSCGVCSLLQLAELLDRRKKK